MAVYEYRCPVHGKFEVAQRISEEPLKTCPGELTVDFHIVICNQPVERLISSTAFSLKGSGWAKDGYK